MRIHFCVLFLTLCVSSTSMAQTREEVVRADREKVQNAGFWMYNDIPGAFATAKETGKPIVVVLRCLPCHECVKLDDVLVDTDPVIRPLLEQFVCVRQVATNGLDLTLFQYDTDQSFAVFLLNADKTIYGRFGTRSHRTEWLQDVSLEGLGKALQGALDLHQDYATLSTTAKATVKKRLAGKRGQPMEVASPEMYPSLKDKFTDALDYDGDVVKSCIHCHQIGDAQREFYWHAKKPIPEAILFPYPHPKEVGLVMDPDEMATVKDILADSAASRAGLEMGDVLTDFNGQPMLSIADIQWVLHHIDPAGENVSIGVDRSGVRQNLTLKLEDGWRKAGDLSWRVTSWGLRRIAAGGMVLESLREEQRSQMKLGPHRMALRVKRAGKYGPHGTARRIGFKENDVIIEFDGSDDLQSEQQLHAYVATQKKHGESVVVKVLRDDQLLTLELPIQP